MSEVVPVAVATSEIAVSIAAIPVASNDIALAIIDVPVATLDIESDMDTAVAAVPVSSTQR